MDFIHIDNIIIEVEWKNIKNIHLTVYPPDARVHISAPMEMSIDSIKFFAIDKLDWINQKIKLISDRERQNKREYVTGENHYFKGVRYRLNVIIQNTQPKVEIKGTQFINLYVKENSSLEKKKEVMNQWYRNELKYLLSGLIIKWEKKLDVKAIAWDVLQMKTQWGSCNNKTKKILFNLELIKKPVHCIEYIVIHELIHLIERLHNDNFIDILDKNLPNWRTTKDELNNFIASEYY